jgi:branched-chain amino acid transport system ATP-binding protein
MGSEVLQDILGEGAQAVPILSIDDLHLKIGKVSLLKGVSFDIQEGEMLGLIGPNGCGKTTLFNSISGFLTPHKGSIIFRGEDLLRRDAHERALKGIGRVFQNFGIFRELSLLENMLLALEAKQGSLQNFLPWGAQARKNKEQALALLAEVSLAEKSEEKASSLSGGQMRLLEIIRSIAFGADMLLLDEPTAGVSPKMKHEVAELIIRLGKIGKSVLLIEHDMNFIQEFCRRILVMEGGKIILDDTPARVRADERLQEIYFGRREPARGPE